MSARSIRARLLAHYRAHQRAFPWRGERDPYRVWLSEIMLQQTRTATVAARYGEFATRFPDVHSLASAKVETVCEAWAGLGYYRRAINLHSAAKRIVRDHVGVFPRTLDALRALPGVGDYTAGAILSIAFDEPVPAVDGNAERVIARLFAIDEPADRATGRNTIHELASRLASGPRPGDVNQALMDLGATVCTARTPMCGACPVSPFCASFAAGRAHLYPRRAAAPRPKRRLAVALLLRRTADRRVWLERRATRGLWAGQWNLPGEEAVRWRDCRARLAHRFDVELSEPLASVRHELTHRTVDARVYVFRGTDRWKATADFRAFPDPLDAPISTLAKRAIRAALDIDRSRRHPPDPTLPRHPKPATMRSR